MVDDEAGVVVSVELSRRDDGRLTGRVVEGNRRVPFSGTLELVGALETCLRAGSNSAAPICDGDDGEPGC